MARSGFKLQLNNTIIKTDEFTEISQSFWVAVGIYNGHYYIPINCLTPEAFIDETAIITLNKNYIKEIIQHLTNFVTSPKLLRIIKSHINIALMRARTTRLDGKLNGDVVLKLELLVKGISDQTQIKAFRENIKNILPEYECA
jgi:hypothetical protein